ncbi:MAG TPA: hypothetical protein VHT73_17610, partial [Thermodesulfobacteriota bacterium]|nr:hypothetical protein [Thermodesulfobacteriota bacterium]
YPDHCTSGKLGSYPSRNVGVFKGPLKNSFREPPLIYPERQKCQKTTGTKQLRSTVIRIELGMSQVKKTNHSENTGE